MFMIVRRSLVLSMILLALAASLSAQSRGGEQRGRSGPGTGNPDEHLVPWKFLPIGAEPVKLLRSLGYFRSASE